MFGLNLSGFMSTFGLLAAGISIGVGALGIPLLPKSATIRRIAFVVAAVAFSASAVYELGASRADTAWRAKWEQAELNFVALETQVETIVNEYRAVARVERAAQGEKNVEVMRTILARLASAPALVCAATPDDVADDIRLRNNGARRGP